MNLEMTLPISAIASGPELLAGLWAALLPAAIVGPALLLMAMPLMAMPLLGGTLAHDEHASRLARVVMALCLVSLAAALLSLLPVDKLSLTSSGAGGVGALLLVDGVSASMAGLIAFLGWAIVGFAARALRVEPRRALFVRWLAATVGCGLLMAVSGNLLLLVLAWLGMSLCLHQLLVFYPERPAAHLAARKKFVISRAGDLFLVGALALLYRDFGTWQIEPLLAAASQPGGAPAGLPLAASLLALGAILKTAQFPFHSWLPDAMETPTPVSALMHAGVVNAGGYLLIRMGPLVTSSSSALWLLAVCGTITAVYGALAMSAQISVKRALAYSTVAQMGLLLLQCGLGAYGLAMVHLLAHSLYKAYAFLSAGSAVEKRLALSPASQTKPLQGLVGAVAAAGMATASLALASWLLPAHAGKSGAMLANVLLFIALTTLAWELLSAGGLRAMGAAAGATAAIALAYQGLHHAGELLVLAVSLGAAPVMGTPMATPMATAEWAVSLLACGAWALYVLGRCRPQWVHVPLMRGVRNWLYVNAANGFYISLLARRIVMPAQASQAQSHSAPNRIEAQTVVLSQ